MPKKAPHKVAAIHREIVSAEPSEAALRQATTPYPTWDGCVSWTRKEAAPTDDPVKIQVPEVLRVAKALVASGRIPASPEDPPKLLAARPFLSEVALQYIQSLTARGVDGDKLIRMLVGLDSEQDVPLPMLVNTVLRLAGEKATAKALNARLLHEERRYRARMKEIANDPAISASSRAGLENDIGAALVALKLFRAQNTDRPQPGRGITVKPSTDLSRQGFWSQALPPFVEYLARVLGSREDAYRALAHTLHLVFGYPDQPSLIKRRFLHRMRSSSN